jgi:hypothetical protein
MKTLLTAVLFLAAFSAIAQTMATSNMGSGTGTLSPSGPNAAPPIDTIDRFPPTPQPTVNSSTPDRSSPAKQRMELDADGLDTSRTGTGTGHGSEPDAGINTSTSPVTP